MNADELCRYFTGTTGGERGLAELDESRAVGVANVLAALLGALEHGSEYMLGGRRVEDRDGLLQSSLELRDYLRSLLPPADWEIYFGERDDDVVEKKLRELGIEC